ncbi:MAG: DPP IV N-terminal domain-containing protein [Bacteroidales bacterium]|nr:DPP IV N-terminal domain-containing protein [Bacteroidales bacterium]
MRRSLLLLCTALLGGALHAQHRVIDVHPAHDGKDLTMEDVILNRKVWPENRYYSWVDANQYRFFDGIRRDTVRINTAVEAAPIGGWTAFNVGNSLSITDGRDTVAVAVSNDRDLVYGQAVSRNEFGIDEGWYWSPSGRRLAFFRKDESRVTDFPLLDITTRTGTLRTTKYPMNGMDSETVALGVYDLDRGGTIYLAVDDFGADRYLAGISWSPDDRFLYVQVLDRSQHHLRLNQYSAATGAFVKTLLTEDNDAWVEPLDPVRFLEGRGDLFIYRTDNRDGYKNLYLADTLGGVRRLTAVDADVEYVANDGRSVWYTSAEVSPVENHLFRIRIDAAKGRPLRKVRFGAPERLTPERGWHNIAMNPDCTWYFDRYSNLGTPGVTRLCSTDGKRAETLATASDPLADFAACTVELGTVPSADGQYENYYRLLYPKDFDPARKYPVILYVYGGPHSQMVTDSWLGNIRMWEMLMAQRGYLVYIQDNRGTQNRGADFEKAINRACGQAEMADQMVGIDRLRALPYVDADRIGVHGWSYGGFMTISLMTTYPDVFKVGVAGGPVIDWKWYEVMYGERYMDTPETNPEGFARTSLLDKAPRLRGRLLICQGAVDPTVVWEHSLSFIQECIDHGVPVDYFPYPLAEHNVRGPNRVHLMDKVTRYFADYL